MAANRPDVIFATNSMRYVAAAMLAWPFLCLAEDAAEPFFGIKVHKTALENAAADDLKKPATLSYNRPSDGSSTYASDIAFSKFFTRWGAEGNTPGWTKELSGFGETHKNTLGKKQQDATYFGTTLKFRSGEMAANTWVWQPRVSTSFSRDRIAHTGTVLIQADTTWLQTAYGINSEIHREILGHKIALTWAPVVGAEYQNAVRTPTDTDRGSVTRYYASGDLTLTPFAALDVITVSLFAKGWQETNRSGLYDTGDKARHFASAGIYWRIYGAKKSKQLVSVALTRETGENPTEALPESSVTKLSFTFKFD